MSHPSWQGLSSALEVPRCKIQPPKICGSFRGNYDDMILVYRYPYASIDSSLHPTVLSLHLSIFLHCCRSFRPIYLPNYLILVWHLQGRLSGGACIGIVALVDCRGSKWNSGRKNILGQSGKPVRVFTPIIPYCNQTHFDGKFANDFDVSSDLPI